MTYFLITESVNTGWRVDVFLHMPVLHLATILAGSFDVNYVSDFFSFCILNWQAYTASTERSSRSQLRNTNSSFSNFNSWFLMYAPFLLYIVFLLSGFLSSRRGWKTSQISGVFKQISHIFTKPSNVTCLHASASEIATRKRRLSSSTDNENCQSTGLS